MIFPIVSVELLLTHFLLTLNLHLHLAHHLINACLLCLFKVRVFNVYVLWFWLKNGRWSCGQKFNVLFYHFFLHEHDCLRETSFQGISSQIFIVFIDFLVYEVLKNILELRSYIKRKVLSHKVLIFLFFSEFSWIFLQIEMIWPMYPFLLFCFPDPALIFMSSSDYSMIKLRK